MEAYRFKRMGWMPPMSMIEDVVPGNDADSGIGKRTSGASYHGCLIETLKP
jgi:hypothetical protein